MSKPMPIWTAALRNASKEMLSRWAEEGDRLAEEELERRNGVGRFFRR